MYHFLQRFWIFTLAYCDFDQNNLYMDYYNLAKEAKLAKKFPKVFHLTFKIKINLWEIKVP